ncbi:DNA polymerase III epsilon subunit [Desulfovibrio sp. DV]|uniref:3'-5' exonuclease n=1 Tax=Desulfovibrio sp. DV TaxID=1844708 RepID=UPI000960C94B|nr:3'-5' exonuclease [Desulfovibrio sp. DV]OLN31214.1 DNA polymerase III epsilon subunit [Desulfovibrio sp. DV]
MPWLSGLLARLTRGLSSGEAHGVLAAHRAAQAGRDPRMLLDALPFVAVDTELTGFDPRRDAVVSVAAVRLRGLSIMAGETYATLVRPDRDVPRDSSLIHRLTATALDSAPPMAEALAGLLEFIGPAVIIGHHVDLDMAFFNAASRRYFGGELAAPCIDTLRLAMAYEEKRLTLEGGGSLNRPVSLCRPFAGATACRPLPPMTPGMTPWLRPISFSTWPRNLPGAGPCRCPACGGPGGCGGCDFFGERKIGVDGPGLLS